MKINLKKSDWIEKRSEVVKTLTQMYLGISGFEKLLEHIDSKIAEFPETEEEIEVKEILEDVAA